MEESSLTDAPSILDGDNYETWAVRMTIHLQALDAPLPLQSPAVYRYLIISS